MDETLAGIDAVGGFRNQARDDTGLVFTHAFLYVRDVGRECFNQVLVEKRRDSSIRVSGNATWELLRVAVECDVSHLVGHVT
mgnify:CR=1 FL=1